MITTTALVHASARSLVLLLLGAPLAAQGLQWAKNPTNQHWYGVPFLASNWPDGESLAVTEGGHLATIRSLAENNWVASALPNINGTGIWIGANDIASEGNFAWTSGEPFSYSNWSFGEPNNTGGIADAVRMLPGFSWRWDDTDPTISSYTPLVETTTVPRAGWTLPRTTATQTMPSNLAVGDVDGDGQSDLVVPNAGSNSFTILRGDGSGAFPIVSSVPTANNPTAIVLADFDADGRLDVAVAGLLGQRLRIHFQDVGGGFNTFFDITHPGGGSGLDVADFDGDLLPDLAETTVDAQDRLLVHRNLGNRTFAPAATYASGSRPRYVTAGDLDGDGDVDLVVTNYDSDDIGIYFNTGNGSFVTSALLARGNGPSRAAIADLNGDGMQDILVPERLDGTMHVYFGSGGGQFVDGFAVQSGVEPNWVLTGDFDGDPFVDLAVAAFQTDAIIVFHGLGGGALTGPERLRAEDGAIGLVAADFDGDGRRDLATSGTNSARVATLLKLSRDCNANGVDDPRDIALGTSTDCNGNGEPDECDVVQGSMFDCNVNGLVDACEFGADPSLDLDGDMVLDECEVAGAPYCFGDGTGAACPCDPGQSGNLGSGCRNSSGNGARMDAFGNPAVANDSVTLCVAGLLNTTTGLFFQGTAQQNGGLGALRGDGLLCVTGTIVRLEIRMGQGGTMKLGRGMPGDEPVSVQGLLPAVGGTRYYQLWFRDSVPFCTTSTFNFTNGVRIVWTP